MGRPTSKVFGEVETFEELRNTLFQRLVNYPHMMYMSDEALQVAISGLQDMDEKCQKQVLRYARHVDRKLSISGTKSGNIYHKLPTILAGSIYLRYFPQQVKDLTLDELILLSRRSITESSGFYENSIGYLGQDLLNAVVTKHFDYMIQSTLLNYAESKIKKGEPKENVAQYIREVPLDKLNEESFEYEKQILEEVGKYL